MITREDNLKEIVKHYRLYKFIPQDQIEGGKNV